MSLLKDFSSILSWCFGCYRQKMYEKKYMYALDYHNFMCDNQFKQKGIYI